MMDWNAPRTFVFALLCTTVNVMGCNEPSSTTPINKDVAVERPRAESNTQKNNDADQVLEANDTTRKAKATASPVVDHQRVTPSKDDVRRAGDAVQGYYQALIDKDFARASSFVHPTFVAPLRSRFMADLKQGTAAQQKKTLKTLGLKSHAGLAALTPSKFFFAFIRSPYGKGLRFLSDEHAKAKLSIKATKCRDDVAFCMVALEIESNDARGQRTNDFPVSASPRDGLWLIGAPPPPRLP